MVFHRIDFSSALTRPLRQPPAAPPPLTSHLTSVQLYTFIVSVPPQKRTIFQRRPRASHNDYFISSDVSRFHSVSCKIVHPQSRKKFLKKSRKKNPVQRIIHEKNPAKKTLYGSNPPALLTCCSRQKVSLTLGTNGLYCQL